MGVPPRVVRRCVIDPLFVPVATGLAVVAVVVAGLGLLGAPVDRRLRLTRSALLAVVYLATEAVVLVVAFGLWLAGPFLRGRSAGAHLWVLRRALALLVAAARRFVRFRLDIREPPRGPADATGSGAPGPRVLVISRHAGVGDSFVLVHLLLSHYHLVPRVVLLHRMQLDPAIDVLLNRLDACFLRNNGSDDHAARRIGELAARLGDGEAMMIFPEGTNFTPWRRHRLIDRLRARGQWARAAIAEDLDAVLPPRPDGVLAALAARTITGTMVVAHAGLDELSTMAQLWAAIPFTSPLQLRWWWVPVADIPASRDERRAWLTMHWAVVNAWIGLSRDAASQGDAAGQDVRSGGPS